MIKSIINVFILLLLVGCNGNYEMKESNGKLYRINKNTGNVDLIEGKNIIPLKLGSEVKNVNHWQNAPIINVIGNDTILSFFEYINGDPADSNNWKFIAPPTLTREQMDAVANQSPWVKYKKDKKK